MAGFSEFAEERPAHGECPAQDVDHGLPIRPHHQQEEGASGLQPPQEICRLTTNEDANILYDLQEAWTVGQAMPAAFVPCEQQPGWYCANTPAGDGMIINGNTWSWSSPDFYPAGPQQAQCFGSPYPNWNSWADACGGIDGDAAEKKERIVPGGRYPSWNKDTTGAPFKGGHQQQQQPGGPKTGNGRRNRRGGKKGKNKDAEWHVQDATPAADSAGETTGSGQDGEEEAVLPTGDAADGAELEDWLSTLLPSAKASTLDQSPRICKGICLKLEEGKENGEACKDAQRVRDLIVPWLLEGNRTLQCSKLKNSCRVVQEALAAAKRPEKGKFLQQIVSGFKDLYNCPNGNYVVQKLVEVLAADALTPLIECFLGNELTIARDRFGCRMWERLIEQCQDNIEPIVTNLLQESSEALCRHQFGNFVISSLLEHRASAHSIIVGHMLEKLPQLVMHRTSSHVVQKALQSCDAAHHIAIVQALLEAPAPHSLVDVCCHKAGSYVILELADLSWQKHPQLRALLVEVRAVLENSEAQLQDCAEAKAKQRVLDCLEKLPAR